MVERWGRETRVRGVQLKNMGADRLQGHREQDRANEADAGQLCSKSSAGNQQREEGRLHPYQLTHEEGEAL